MKRRRLIEDKDPMGRAIYEYFTTGKAGKLRVFSSQFDEDELPVKDLFRTLEQMPLLEQKALQLAYGRILDVGAGSGCHSLVLQEMGKESLAIDISPWAVEVMKKRGIDACLTNVFDMGFTGRFDTILMLMNGSGIIGKLKNMPAFLTRVKQLLAPGGCVLMDSTDLRYLYEDEDGSYLVDLAADYYGEVDFQMQYGKVKGEPFDWLYIDFDTLSAYATPYGFRVEKVMEGEHYDYLARLSLR